MIGTAKDKQQVDRDGAVPLYHQIFLLLRDEIISGVRPYGTAVPTEAELSAALDVSRITARRALDELAQHRFVERRRRVGTRVIFRPQAKPLAGSIDQALESLIDFGRNTKVRVRLLIDEAANAEIAALLGLEEGDKVTRAVRLRLLDGEPLGMVVSHMPAHLGKLITKSNLTRRPLLEILKTAGVKIGEARQTITAVAADAAFAAALEVEARSPILSIHRTVFDSLGRPILTTHAQYRGDRYLINLDLRGGALQ